MEPSRDNGLFCAILTQMGQAGKQGCKQASKQPASGEDSKQKKTAPNCFFCYPHPRLALQPGDSQPSAFQPAAGENSNKRNRRGGLFFIFCYPYQRLLRCLLASLLATWMRIATKKNTVSAGLNLGEDSKKEQTLLPISLDIRHNSETKLQIWFLEIAHL